MPETPAGAPMGDAPNPPQRPSALRDVTMFTRKQCSLCDKAYAALARVREGHPFNLVVVDLDAEATPEKRAAYDLEVPVVELEGRKIMKYRVDEIRLLRLLGDAEPPR